MENLLQICKLPLVLIEIYVLDEDHQTIAQTPQLALHTALMRRSIRDCHARKVMVLSFSR